MSKEKPYRKYKLPNGVRAVFVPQENTAAATVLILFRVGSRYEKPEINGLSHFIEHMMFKGTRRRPTTPDISRALDSVGAEYNAFTDRDVTGYYIKVDNRHVPLALDMLEDMLFHSKFDPDEFERERKVIHEEIHMYRDNPAMHIEDMIGEEIFAGNALGWPIAGSEESMNMIRRNQMLEYYHRYYIPGRTVLTIAGNFPKNTDAAVKKLFGRYKPHGPAGAGFKKFIPTAGVSKRVKIEFRDTEQAQLALGFPAYGHMDTRLPALTVFSAILGGTMSSRLFIQVRERKGLAYSIRTGMEVHEDTGSFEVRAGLARARTEEALGTIMEELRKAKKGGVTGEELRRAKENIRGRMAIGLEESSEVAAFYARQELFTNTMRTPEEKVEKILRVTKEDVQKIAKDILRENRLSLAIIGPYKEEKPFKALLQL